MAPPDREKGFVLISAIWLLVLAGSIVAILMLRGVQQASEAVKEAKNLQERFAAEGAAQTVIADMLIEGSGSRWAQTPSSGRVLVGEIGVSVQVSSEAGRIDLNDGDLAVIQETLRRLGLGAAELNAVAERLKQKRLQGIRLGSVDEFLAWAPEIRADIDPVRMFTVVSGLAIPNYNQVLPGSRQYFPQSPAAMLTGAPTGQIPLRISSRAGVGREHISTVRLNGRADDPYRTVQ